MIIYFHQNFVARRHSDFFQVQTLRAYNIGLMILGETRLYKQEDINKNQGILEGDLLFDWFGLVCFANKNKNCQLSYR